MIASFLLALLAFLTLAAIVAPLLRGGRESPGRSRYDQAVYRDQLRELDRDIARGLIAEADTGSTRLEIQRRLIAADRESEQPARLSRSPVMALLVAVIIGGGSVAGYLWLGQPGMPDDPYAGRKQETARDTEPPAMRKAADALAERLRQNPNDADGWLLYGRTLSMIGNWDAAEDAYARAIALGRTSAEVLSDHAETLTMKLSGTVAPAAEAEFKQVLQADPGNVVARYYLSVALMQAGEPRKAMDGFLALLGDLPSDMPARQRIAEKLADAARAAGMPMPPLPEGTAPAAKPDAATAASMPDDQRETMIRGMVAQLAAKQAADPGNLDGWLRLGKAYAVMHDDDNAVAAFDKAATLRPDDISIRLQEVRALLGDTPPTAKIPARIVALLKQIQSADPGEPIVLWYLGVAAAQDGRKDDALALWRALLAKMPQDGEDTKLVQAAIDALQKR